MDRPQLALISLDAPSLQQSNKVHHAADVFPWLQAQGLAKWARYRGSLRTASYLVISLISESGHGEYFIWSDIPGADAVLHTLDLEEFIDQLNDDEECQTLLNFEVFKHGTKTTTIASALREKNTTLNTTTARALGKAAKAFGLARSTITLDHLQDFIARLIDGWTIIKPDTMDIHTMSSLAATFATALGSHNAGYTLQDIMGAFVRGVEDGERCIAHWSKSRSGSRRRRFRDV